MIFAVGARRSGTNWLQRVLDAHPNVAAVPSETYIFALGLLPLRERFHHGSLSSSQTGAMFADRDVLFDAMRDFCDAVFGALISSLDPSAQRLVERTPDHVRNLDLIADVYPDAHVVHIVRDGRDVVRSLLSQSWGPTDARAAATEWRTAIEAAREGSARIANFHEVRYEELHADPAAVIPKLYAALELDVDDALVAHALAEAGATHNVDPKNPRVAVGKWQGGLSPEDVATVADVAGDLLVELGYAEDGPAPVPTPAPRPKLRLKRRREKRTDRTERLHQLAQGQIVLNRFLSAATGDVRSVPAMLTDDVHVRIVSRGTQSEARGAEAVRRLLDALSTDPALLGRQEVGYIHPSLPAFTWVGRFAHEGRSHPRVFVIDVRGEQVSRVALYALE
jgi:LPS sulfotransferase NodH